MDKVENLKTKLIEAISDEIGGIEKEIEKLEMKKGKLEDKVSLIKTRI